MKGAASLPDGNNPEGLDCSAPASQGGVGTSLTWKPGALGSAPSILHDPAQILAACHRCFPCPVLPLPSSPCSGMLLTHSIPWYPFHPSVETSALSPTVLSLPGGPRDALRFHAGCRLGAAGSSQAGDG